MNFHDIDKQFKKEATGTDWLMLFFYGLCVAQLPIVQLEHGLFKTFLIPNIIYLVFLGIMFFKRLKEKKSLFYISYVIGFCIIIFFLFLEYQMYSIGKYE